MLTLENMPHYIPCDFVKWLWTRMFKTQWSNTICYHHNDVIMNVMVSQITSLRIVCSTVYLGADQRKRQSSASLAFVRGIHRSPVNCPHKEPGSNAENVSIWWRHHPKYSVDKMPLNVHSSASPRFWPMVDESIRKRWHSPNLWCVHLVGINHRPEEHHKGRCGLTVSYA